MDHANLVTRKRQAPTTLDLWDAFDDLRREFERTFGDLEFPASRGSSIGRLVPTSIWSKAMMRYWCSLISPV
jgi:hypothetical protein